MKAAPETSIVMAAYKRAAQLEATLESIALQTYRDYEIIVVEDGYDGGATKHVCGRFNVRYTCRRDRPDVPFSNCAVPMNIGIQQARGRVLVMQFPEVKHVHAVPAAKGASKEVLEALVAPHRENSNLAVFASCIAVSRHGYEENYLNHPKFNRAPFFHCGSVLREHVIAVGGFEEELLYYGYEDNFMALCLEKLGLKFVWRDDILTHHQWHDNDHYRMDLTGQVYAEKVKAIREGKQPAKANIEREWGVYPNDH